MATRIYPSLPKSFPKGHSIGNCFYQIGQIKVSKGSEIYQDALKLSAIGYGPMDAIILDYYMEETTFDRRHWPAIQEARKSWRF